MSIEQEYGYSFTLNWINLKSIRILGKLIFVYTDEILYMKCH